MIVAGIKALPFELMRIEVADFESYEGCSQLSDINDFMIALGCREFSRSKCAKRAKRGNYFNVVYKGRA